MTPTVDMHCSANMKNTSSAAMVGASNRIRPADGPLCTRMPRSEDAGSSGVCAAATWPRVATKVSRAASEDRMPMLIRQSKPSGSKTGSIARPTDAAYEWSRT